MSTSLLEVPSSSEAREESDVDEGEALGVSDGEMLAEEATLLEVVEAGTRYRTALGGSAVVDMVGKRELLEGIGHLIMSVVLGRYQTAEMFEH